MPSSPGRTSAPSLPARSAPWSIAVRQCYPACEEKQGGKIILISSTLSRDPGFGLAAHCAAKTAVDSIARTMALELGPANTYRSTAADTCSRQNGLQHCQHPLSGMLDRVG
ncbi:MAG: SDR family NAD(P)-dependent oxidoreductase [Deltaproteobacteria bacterium]